MYRIVTLVTGLFLLAAPAHAQFWWEGTIAFEEGERNLGAAVVSPDGAFAYFATYTSPAQVVKVDLETFERVDAVMLEEGENSPSVAAVDPSGEFAYFGMNTEPGRVVRIDLETFERVDAVMLEEGENFLQGAVIDPGGAFAYFATFTDPGRVVKIDLETFERVNAITFEAGEKYPIYPVMDPGGAVAYFGTLNDSGPSRVIKVDLSTFERVEALTLESNDRVASAVISPDGAFAYFGTRTLTGRVVKVDLEAFERVDGIFLQGEKQLISAVIDPDGAFAYFGTQTNPGRVLKIDLEAFEWVDAITLEEGTSRLAVAVIEPDSQQAYAYFGTVLTDPARVAKVHVFDGTWNDDVADAIAVPIEGGSYTKVYNAHATLEEGEPEPSCTFSNWTTNFSLWWRFTPEEDGLAIIDTNGSLTPQGSGLDTILSLHNPDDLSEIACNDDNGSGGGWSRLEDVPIAAGETYLIRVAAYNESPFNQGTVRLTAAFQFGVADEAPAEEFAEGVSLLAPNPASASTSLSLRVVEAQQVYVELFDATGRRVQTLFDGVLAAGTAEVLTFDSSTLPAGVYVVRAMGESFVETRRFIVIQ